MTDITAAELAPRIDTVVTAVDGVHQAYSARPIVARTYERAADVDGSLAAVHDGRGSRDITVCIGVTADKDSADVAARVADAVRAAGSDDSVSPRVRVRVARLVAPAS